MLKEIRKILKKCLHYRVPKNLDTGGIGYCDPEDQTECTREIQFCKNPEVLKEYLLERGLGWQKQKARNRFKGAQQAIGRLANACWK